MTPSRSRADVLYLHPGGHLNDLVVPMGALACMNAIRAPKLGRYAFELDDEEVRAARIVALDLHWALGLPAFERLVSHVRSVQPDARIVVGGITAASFAEELVREYPIDCVVRGDSEVAFASLVSTILEDKPMERLANVVTRGSPRAESRMTNEEFDATDSLTADWFPTYRAYARWDAAAFPHGPGISVARGCGLRCPGCYGSFAETYGNTVLVRSPQRVAELVGRAAAERARNLSLTIGKLGGEPLARVLHAIARAGPHRFDSPVGLYVCTPLTVEHVELLAEAFVAPVHVFRVPPDEHVPALSPQRLAREEEAWVKTAAHFARTPHLSLETCATTGGDVRRHRRALAVVASPRVRVCCSAGWQITRPGDERGSTLDQVRSAMEQAWTVLAARLLSPSLARRLQPYQLLDGVDEDPTEGAVEPGVLEAASIAMRSAWERHRLPLLEGITFAVVPIASCATAVEQPSNGPVRLEGDLRHRTRLQSGTTSTPLAVTHGGSGVTLSATLAPAAAYAFVPVPSAERPLHSAWLEALLEDGLVTIDVSEAPAEDAVEITIELVLQEARVLVTTKEARILASGRAQYPFYQPPPRRTRPLHHG